MAIIGTGPEIHGAPTVLFHNDSGFVLPQGTMRRDIMGAHASSNLQIAYDDMPDSEMGWQSVRMFYDGRKRDLRPGRILNYTMKPEEHRIIIEEVREFLGKDLKNAICLSRNSFSVDIWEPGEWDRFNQHCEDNGYKESFKRMLSHPAMQGDR